jgi:hypothetical protein
MPVMRWGAASSPDVDCLVSVAPASHQSMDQVTSGKSLIHRSGLVGY